MTKRTLSIILILFFTQAASAQEQSSEQSFQKGSKILETGIRLAIYATTAKDPDYETDEKDAAASYTIPIMFEYAVSNKIGVGVEVGFTNFFTAEDTITKAIATAGSIDFMLKGSFHFVRTRRVDLSAGIGIGFSPFHYESKDSRNTEFKATGSVVDLSMINARFYFSEHFGIKVNFGIAAFNYKYGRITDDIGNDYDFEFKLAGANFGTGIVVKL